VNEFRKSVKIIVEVMVACFFLTHSVVITTINTCTIASEQLNWLQTADRFFP